MFERSLIQFFWINYINLYIDISSVKEMIHFNKNVLLKVKLQSIYL